MYIYKIQNKINDKCYIGQTKNFKNRMTKHEVSKAIDYLHNAIRKYGWNNFTKEIICECSDNIVDSFELAYQKIWKSHYTQNGYNIVIGGQGFRKHSEESNQKNREAHLGKKHSEKTKQICRESSMENQWAKGCKHTKEQNLAKSERLRGIEKTAEHKEKLRQAAIKQWQRQAESQHNRKLLQSNNTSGFRGVSYFKTNKKWRARIGIKGKQKHLGYFDSAIKAALAYDNAIIDNSQGQLQITN